MCMTSAKASLSKTKILSVELENGRHSLSYSNSVTNTSGIQNSMILPVPGKLNKKWFKDTAKYSKYLKEIERQAKLSRDESMGIYSRGFDVKGMRSKGIERFNVGMYDVLISDDIRKTAERLGALGPQISEELLSFFETQYKGWNFVMCIFEGSEKMDSQPIYFEYEPFNKSWLYFPTMDSHDGGAPNLEANVSMDHSLMYDYPGLVDRVVHNVDFSQKVPQKLMRRNYVSTKWDDRIINGDFYLHLPTLHKQTNNKEGCYQAFKRSAVFPEANVFA